MGWVPFFVMMIVECLSQLRIGDRHRHSFMAPGYKSG